MIVWLWNLTKAFGFDLVLRLNIFDVDISFGANQLMYSLEQAKNWGNTKLKQS